MDSALIHQLGDFKDIEIYRSSLADWVQLPLDTPVYLAAFEGTFICRERSLPDEDCLHLCIVIQHLHHKMAKVGGYSITEFLAHYLVDSLDPVEFDLYGIFE
jgi:hypothetical protein